jgi:hypothetical protein
MAVKVRREHEVRREHALQSRSNGRKTMKHPMITSPFPGAALIALSALAGGARAAVLAVPAQFPTIQAAIVAATTGDEIVVAPGTYAERIDFLGKAITVHSSGGAAVTTIDGGHAGSTVSFTHAETGASVLAGFTITGGTGSVDPWPFGPGGIVGGGVLIFTARPTLADLVITGNSADRGAGLLLEINDQAGQARLQNCTIAGNSATSTGGGIDTFMGFAALDGCTLQGNTAAFGGGLHNDGGALTVTHGTLSGNSAVSGGGAMTSNLNGGGLLLQDCLIENNHASSAGGGLFATVHVDGFSLNGARAESCRFVGNTGSVGAAVFASGSSLFGSPITISSCLIAGCGPAGAPAVTLQSGTELAWCTVVDNLGPGIAGSAQSTVTGSIVRGNVGAQLQGMSATWSDIEGGAPGVGNVDVDPLFVDAAGGDYHLAVISPCRDKGNPATGGSTVADVDGETRVQGGRIDIGADELAPFLGFQDVGFALAGGAGTPLLSGSGSLVAGQPIALSLTHGKPHASTTLVLGGSLLSAPFKGGTMIPALDQLVTGLVTNGAGAIALGGTWPAGLPAGFTVYLQAWIQDGGAPAGFSASNGLAAGTP